MLDKMDLQRSSKYWEIQTEISVLENALLHAFPLRGRTERSAGMSQMEKAPRLSSDRGSTAVPNRPCSDQLGDNLPMPQSPSSLNKKQ